MILCMCVIAPTRICPEGAARYGVRISSPFRAKRFSGLTQGKPWAKLSCPYGAGPSGCMTGAKHIRPFFGAMKQPKYALT